MYHFERRTALRDGNYILREVSHTEMDSIIEVRVALRKIYFIIEGRVACRNKCMDKYVPYESRIERQRVCIVSSDMNRYTWYWISLSLVYLILCVANLVSAFL